jgi:hypothetical protein
MGGRHLGYLDLWEDLLPRIIRNLTSVLSMLLRSLMLLLDMDRVATP